LGESLNFGIDVMFSYHKSLEKCLDILDENPDLGTVVDHIRLGYLYFEHHSHLIFYKKINQDISIIRILHKSMDVSGHFI